MCGWGCSKVVFFGGELAGCSASSRWMGLGKLIVVVVSPYGHAWLMHSSCGEKKNVVRKAHICDACSKRYPCFT
jgi:hypothetical protein